MSKFLDSKIFIFIFFKKNLMTSKKFIFIFLREINDKISL